MTVKTSFERSDVSRFRQLVRDHLFHTAFWLQKLEEFETRLQGGKRANPPVMLIMPDVGDTKVATVESEATGKTDFVYYATDYFRQKGYSVLAFPDLRRQEIEDFFRDIFVPEMFRVGEKTWRKQVYNAFLYTKEYMRSAVQCAFLFIRVSVVALGSVLLFLLGAGFSALKYFVELNAEQSLPPMLKLWWIPWGALLLGLIGIIFVWDRVKEKHYGEWKSCLPTNNIKAAQQENANKLSVTDVQKYLHGLGERMVIIVDDAEQCDAVSLNHLLSLAERAPSQVGLIFLRSYTLGRGDTDRLLSHFEALQRGWQVVKMPLPSVEVVRLLFWKYYSTKKCDEIIGFLLSKFPSLKEDSPLLLKFLYKISLIVEKGGVNFEEITDEKLAEWFVEFRKRYTNLADQIISPLKSSSYYLAGKEFLKILLAFQGLTPDMYIVEKLMGQAGYPDVRPVVKILQEAEVIRVDWEERSYDFYDPSMGHQLRVSWKEWQTSAEEYNTRVFSAVAKARPRLIKNSPSLAKRCAPSRLVIDVLWNEGDALWLYGGRPNTQEVLSYYGLGGGALGKWAQIFQRETAQQVTDSTFFWTSKAPNSPYAYLRTSKSPPSYHFVGDLFKTVLEILFSSRAGKEKVTRVLVLWSNALSEALNSKDVSARVKRRMVQTDLEIELLKAQYNCNLPYTKWEETVRVTNMIAEEAHAERIRNDARRLRWKINYWMRYGLGNDLGAVMLVRSPQIEVEASSEVLEPRKTLSDFGIWEIMAHHLLDYLQYKRGKDEFLEVKGEFERVLANWRISIFHTAPRKATQRIHGPDMEVRILLSKGVYSYFVSQFVQIWAKFALPSLPLKNKGHWIRKTYEFCQEAKAFAESYSLKTPLVGITYDLVERTYGDYFSSKNLSRRKTREFAHAMQGAADKCVKSLRLLFLNESYSSFEQGRQLALISGVSLLEMVAEYYALIGTLERLNLLEDENLKQILIHHVNAIRRQEMEVGGIVGKNLEGVRAHVAIGEYEKAYELIAKKEVPLVVKGELIHLYLQRLGNFSEVLGVPPEKIWDYAQRAHEILIGATGHSLIPKKELDERKASVRWWIAESYHRLAGEATRRDPVKGYEYVDEFFNKARPHLNWIERVAEENNLESWIPKCNQVRSGFYKLQGKHKKALKEMEKALNFYRQAVSLSDIERQNEIIQTLTFMLNFAMASGHDLAVTVEKIGAWGSELLNWLRKALYPAREDRLSDSSKLIVLRGIETIVSIVPISQMESEVRDLLLDLCMFGIKGYQDFGLFGKSALVAAKLKKTGERLPEEFYEMVRQAFYKWDPRIEKTNRSSVEQALRFLSTGEGRDFYQEDEHKAKVEILLDAQRLLIRKDPDSTLMAISKLEDASKSIDREDPTEIDIEILYTLRQVHLSVGHIFEVLRLDSEEKRLREVWSSKICLQIANEFEGFPDIQERYLVMAARSKVKSRFSKEAERLLEKRYGSQGQQEGKIVRSEGDLFTFERLMGLSLEEFDQEKGYSLLVVLEIEMRRLISVKFHHLPQWWVQRIPSDVVSRAYKKAGKKVSEQLLLEYVDLPDLFKIITRKDNWEDFF